MHDVSKNYTLIILLLIITILLLCKYLAENFDVWVSVGSEGGAG